MPQNVFFSKTYPPRSNTLLSRLDQLFRKSQNRRMLRLLQKLLIAQQIVDSIGNRIPLFPTSSTPETLSIIQAICHKTKPKRTLEIGLAYGLGSLAILGSAQPESIHISIDPHQQTAFDNIGIKHVAKSNHLGEFIFYEEDSLQVLAKLGDSQLNFVFIDGLHEYSQIIQEVNLLYPFLAPGGVIFFDDTYLPDVRRAIAKTKSVHKDLVDFPIRGVFAGFLPL